MSTSEILIETFKLASVAIKEHSIIFLEVLKSPFVILYNLLISAIKKFRNKTKLEKESIEYNLTKKFLNLKDDYTFIELKLSYYSKVKKLKTDLHKLNTLKFILEKSPIPYISFVNDIDSSIDSKEFYSTISSIINNVLFLEDEKMNVNINLKSIDNKNKTFNLKIKITQKNRKEEINKIYFILKEKKYGNKIIIDNIPEVMGFENLESWENKVKELIDVIIRKEEEVINIKCYPKGFKVNVANIMSFDNISNRNISNRNSNNKISKGSNINNSNSNSKSENKVYKYFCDKCNKKYLNENRYKDHIKSKKHLMKFLN